MERSSHALCPLGSKEVYIRSQEGSLAGSAALAPLAPSNPALPRLGHLNVASWHPALHTILALRHPPVRIRTVQNLHRCVRLDRQGAVVPVRREVKEHSGVRHRLDRRWRRARRGRRRPLRRRRRHRLRRRTVRPTDRDVVIGAVLGGDLLLVELGQDGRELGQRDGLRPSPSVDRRVQRMRELLLRVTGSVVPDEERDKVLDGLGRGEGGQHEDQDLPALLHAVLRRVVDELLHELDVELGPQVRMG
eukprot:scaffold31_cov263-Pinguiococcus_pyrenoidosus.AAC.13